MDTCFLIAGILLVFLLAKKFADSKAAVLAVLICGIFAATGIGGVAIRIYPHLFLSALTPYFLWQAAKSRGKWLLISLLFLAAASFAWFLSLCRGNLCLPASFGTFVSKNYNFNYLILFSLAGPALLFLSGRNKPALFLLLGLLFTYVIPAGKGGPESASLILPLAAIGSAVAVCEVSAELVKIAGRIPGQLMGILSSTNRQHLVRWFLVIFLASPLFLHYEKEAQQIVTVLKPTGKQVLSDADMVVDLSSPVEINGAVIDSQGHLCPAHGDAEGEAIYKIALKPGSRYVLKPAFSVCGKNNYVRLYLSLDGRNYARIYAVDGRRGEECAFLDISGFIRGASCVFVRAKLYASDINSEEPDARLIGLAVNNLEASTKIR